MQWQQKCATSAFQVGFHNPKCKSEKAYTGSPCPLPLSFCRCPKPSRLSHGITSQSKPYTLANLRNIYSIRKYTLHKFPDLGSHVKRVFEQFPSGKPDKLVRDQRRAKLPDPGLRALGLGCGGLRFGFGVLRCLWGVWSFLWASRLKLPMAFFLRSAAFCRDV